MTAIRSLFAVLAFVWAVPIGAAQLPDEVTAQISAAQVVILGEVHDNPSHHARQVAAVDVLKPRAIVWEMLDDVQAARISSELISAPDRMAQVLAWTDAGWPAFTMYHPIFAAAIDSRHYGAGIPRAAARAAMEGGAAAAFGAQAARYGLTIDLPADDQKSREAFQMSAHCDALPADMLPAMVDIQRLRDAALAQAVLLALEETGGPVAVITGNGHARRDWGVPVFLDRVRPGLDVLVVGQSEDGRIEGDFDLVLDSPSVDRPDPCDVFRNHTREDQ